MFIPFRYESTENMTIQCSTKVCSFGKQVVEKVETEYAQFQGGRFVYKLHRSPMCEYMINFIHKLKSLPEKYMMNSVLENFTILQVECAPRLFADVILMLFFFPGDNKPGHAGDPLVHRLRLRGVHLRARSPAPHLQAGQGLARLVRRC